MSLPLPSRRIGRLIALLLLAACGTEGGNPAGVDESALDVSALAARNDSLELETSSIAGVSREFATDSAAMQRAPGREVEFAEWPFPSSLALTDRQKAQIRALRAAFVEATARDMEALRRIMEEARAARAAGKSIAEIEAILARGVAIHERLAQAARRLAVAIEGVFTPEQRRWLARYRACLTASVPTPEQRREVAALKDRFEKAHAADFQAIDDALARIRAVRGDASLTERQRQERIASILESIRPVRERLATGLAALHRAIAAILPVRNCGG